MKAFLPGNFSSGAYPAGGTAALALSDDGRYLAYLSIATNLVAGMSNNNGTLSSGSIPGWDVFLYDCVTGTNSLVSHRPDFPPSTGNRGCTAVSITGDGRQRISAVRCCECIPRH